MNVRRVAVPGLSNLRDLGGLDVTGGATIRRGVVLRAEALAHAATTPDLSVWQPEEEETFHHLGLRTVIDLRSSSEARSLPSAWAAATGAEVVQVPVNEGGEGSETDVMAELLSGRRSRFTVDDLADLYMGMLDRRAPELAQVARILGDEARTPALLHCAAGKDRTGVVVAVLLEALNVPRAQVLEDYELTGTWRPNRVRHYAARLESAGVRPEDVRVLFETPPEAMVVALEHLDERYGGAAAYLVDHGRLTQHELASLRSNLLTST